MLPSNQTQENFLMPTRSPEGISNSKEIKDMYCDESGFFKHVVPLTYRHVTLDFCDMQPQSFINFAKEWGKKPTSIFLHGTYGSGKTQFAFAMIREMFRSCRYKLWPRYFTSPELDRRLLKALKSEEGDEYEIRNIASQDILFIDDIGRETKSERLRNQYFEIFNYRYAHKLPTILTSNFDLDDLNEIIDGSIASRIQEWNILRFKERDLRVAQ